MIASQYGIFAGKAVVIVNIPIAFASAVSAAMIPNISGTYFLGNIKETNLKIDLAVRTTMLISIPSAIGLMVLSRPIIQILFPQASTLMQASKLLKSLSTAVSKVIIILERANPIPYLCYLTLQNGKLAPCRCVCNCKSLRTEQKYKVFSDCSIVLN